MKAPAYHSNDRHELWAYVRRLEYEVERLRKGRLTEEEVQALCHEQDGGCPLRFARGCVAYNRELFGDKARLGVTDEPVQ